MIIGGEEGLQLLKAFIPLKPQKSEGKDRQNDTVAASSSSSSSNLYYVFLCTSFDCIL